MTTPTRTLSLSRAREGVVYIHCWRTRDSSPAPPLLKNALETVWVYSWPRNVVAAAADEEDR